MLFNEITAEVDKGKKKSFNHGFKQALVKTLEITKETEEKEKPAPATVAITVKETPDEMLFSQKLEEVMMQQKKTQELVSQLTAKINYYDKANTHLSELDTRINSLELTLENNKEFVNEKIREFKTDFDNNLRAFNENLFELTTQVSDLRNKMSMSMGEEGEEEEEQPRKASARR